VTVPAVGCIRVERDGCVASVGLDRPPLNILDIPTLQELAAAVADVSQDVGLKVLVLRAVGAAFCAGVDVAEHEPDRVAAMLDAFHSGVRRLLALEIPVIAAVNGVALGGGCELLLGCDVVIASAAARFGQPEIRLGVFPPVASALLGRRIGPAAAADLILTGRVIDAAEAARIGLATRVVAADALDAAVREYAAGLAGLSGPVLRLTKRVLRAGGRLDPDEALRRAESVYVHDLMDLHDAHEGVAAFLEKRAPEWRP
jgi:cyclohexa-1,5-dienecarbonyl-CoA hydratase